jgi:hypothetical protein
MSQDPKYELVLLGATGYTGKLVAEWVTTHLPTDLKWAIAGRNSKKLQGVLAELRQLGPDRKQPGKMSSQVFLYYCTGPSTPSFIAQPQGLI